MLSLVIDLASLKTSPDDILCVSSVSGHCSKLAVRKFPLTFEIILLLPAQVASSIKISEPVPEVPMQAHAVTLPAHIGLYVLDHEQVLAFFPCTSAFLSLW